jgi:hypothetical protein
MSALATAGLPAATGSTRLTFRRYPGGDDRAAPQKGGEQRGANGEQRTVFNGVERIRTAPNGRRVTCGFSCSAGSGFGLDRVDTEDVTLVYVEIVGTCGLECAATRLKA